MRIVAVICIVFVFVSSGALANDDAPPREAAPALIPVSVGAVDGPRFASPFIRVVAASENYATRRIAGTRNDFEAFFVEGSVAKPVIGPDGEPMRGPYLQLQKTSQNIYAMPMVGDNPNISNRRGLFLLNNGKATPVTMADGKPWTSSQQLKFYDSGPEIIQVQYKAEFFRISGTTIAPMPLPSELPKMRHPELVFDGDTTYLLDRHTLTSTTPGKLWILGDQLTQVVGPDDEPKEFGISIFLNFGGKTFAVLEDQETEYRELWRLDKGKFSAVMDSEGDQVEVSNLFRMATTQDHFYTMGWSRRTDDLHLWMVPSTGAAQLVNAGNVLLAGNDLRPLSAGRRAIARVEIAEDMPPENWIVDGALARRIMTEDGPLIGVALPGNSTRWTLLQHVIGENKYRLLWLDSSASARPIRNPDGNAVIGTPERFGNGFTFETASDGIYVIQGKSDDAKTLWYIPD